MDVKFAKLVETLAPKLEHLRAKQPLRYGALPSLQWSRSPAHHRLVATSVDLNQR